MKYNIYLLLLLLGMAGSAAAQQQTAPVIFQGDTLYLIQHNLGGFSPQQRAAMVQNNLYQLAKLPLNEFDSLRVLPSGVYADIIHQTQVIATVTNQDAATENQSATALAQRRLALIRQALIKDYEDHSLSNLGKDIGLFILALLGFFIVFSLVNKAFDFFRANLKNLQRNIFFQYRGFFKLFDLITPETERTLLLFLLRMTRFTVLGLFCYVYLPFLFSQISYTRGFGEQLMGYVLSPLRFLFNSFVGFLPNLLFILIIIVAVRYLIRGLGYVAQQVKKGKIEIEGFFPDWAVPTFNLFRALIIIFTLVILFPYLPGSGSDAFQGISVFVGLLLSLGSAGIINNVISGVILTYMRPFKTGDFVKINEVKGSVVGKNLLVTRVKTTKNEEITIPNAALLGGGVVNYSTLAQKQGLILPTSVTIGYDVPWKQVHELLKTAALRTELVDQELQPFVLQTSLDDWYVAYELNCYTRESHKIAFIYSNLHANIQDVFNEAGVEIMSSHYLAVRDGNTVTVPQNYLQQPYQAPAFKVEQVDKKEETD